MDYTNHSKFAYKNEDQIQQDINNGTLGPYDLVVCRDTKEFILIASDLTLVHIQSKVYRFIDVESAEKILNENTDTYEGQLVSVLSNKGTYEGYIVNKNSKGKYYITPLNVYSGSIDYDSLQHRPITNLEGAIFDPVILDIQRDGIYKVNGSYKISDALDTVFSSMNNNMFIVSHDGDVTYVKKVGSYEIVDYTINNGNVIASVIPTQEWLKEQGYASWNEVDAKIEAMGLITKNEIEEYVQNVVLQTIDATVNERIEYIFDQKFQETTEREIVDIFVK